MTYASFVKRSIGPALLVFVGLLIQEWPTLFLILGGVGWEVWNIAKFLDSHAPSRTA